MNIAEDKSQLSQIKMIKKEEIENKLKFFPIKESELKLYCENLAKLILEFEELTILDKDLGKEAEIFLETFLENLLKIKGSLQPDLEDSSEEEENENKAVVKKLATQINKTSDNCKLLEESGMQLSNVFITSKSLSNEINTTHENLKKEKNIEREEVNKIYKFFTIFIIVAAIILILKLSNK